MTSTEIAAANKIMLGTTEAVAMYIGSNKIWELQTGPIIRLPQGYTEVKYILNTSTAYINTLVLLYDSPTNSYNIQCKCYFQPYGNDYEYLFGTEQTSDPYTGITLRYYQSNIEYSSVPNNVSWTRIDNSDGTSTITASCSSTTATNGDNPLTLFGGLWLSGLWRSGRGKIYSFKVTKNNTLVRDLVPCKNSNNVVGLYDLVNNVFYTSPNGEVFVAGPSIYLEHDYSQDYFTIESLEDNNTITASRVNISTLPDIYYSFDSGETWSNLKLLTGTITFGTINTGEKIIFKCTINNWATAWDTYNRFNGSKNFKAYGNTMSLLYGDNFINNSEFPINSTHNLCALFRDSTNLIDASDLILPATIGTASCYNGMFRGATNLSHGPKVLPATSLNLDSYSSMFEGCINLEEAPEIHATTFSGTGSMMRMFCMSRTSKLTTPKLTKGPVLPATVLALNVYKEMFKGNGNIIEVTCLATSGFGNCSDWLTNCSETGTFYKNSDASGWIRTTSQIPVNWTVLNYVSS